MVAAERVVDGGLIPLRSLYGFGYALAMNTEHNKHDRRRRGTGSITARGRGRWEVRVPRPPDPATGRRRQRSITVHGSRRDAEAELRRLRDRVLPPPGSRAGTRLTLARLLDVWWESKRPTVAASTAREYQRFREPSGNDRRRFSGWVTDWSVAAGMRRPGRDLVTQSGAVTLGRLERGTLDRRRNKTGEWREMRSGVADQAGCFSKLLMAITTVCQDNRR